MNNPDNSSSEIVRQSPPSSPPSPPVHSLSNSLSIATPSHDHPPRNSSPLSPALSSSTRASPDPDSLVTTAPLPQQSSSSPSSVSPPPDSVDPPEPVPNPTTPSELLVAFSYHFPNYKEEASLIEKGIQNIQTFDFDQKPSSAQTRLAQNKTSSIEETIQTFVTFMLKSSSQQVRDIECKLFKLVFSPHENILSTRIFPVYSKHDAFIYDDPQYVNFESSTGSGKTLCSPLFFAIRDILEEMAHPFFIMTQPGRSIITQKMDDFKNLFGDSITLVDNVDELLNMYADTPPAKPVLGLFSPYNALKLISKAQREHLDIISRTRFCLDEIHERHVETDVLVAELSRLTQSQDSFPYQVIMM